MSGDTYKMPKWFLAMYYRMLWWFKTLWYWPHISDFRSIQPHFSTSTGNGKIQSTNSSCFFSLQYPTFFKAAFKDDPRHCRYHNMKYWHIHTITIMHLVEIKQISIICLFSRNILHKLSWLKIWENAKLARNPHWKLW